MRTEWVWVLVAVMVGELVSAYHSPDMQHHITRACVALVGAIVIHASITEEA